MGKDETAAARPHPAHPLNAPGSFYVAEGECMACEAPESEAPDLMGHDDRGHCYFTRQPETAEEIHRAVLAVAVSCCQAVCYSGRDPIILARLDAMRCTRQCDALAPPQIPRDDPRVGVGSMIDKIRAAMRHPLWDAEADL